MDSIIFDVDGTLWDTTELCARAWNEAIKDHSSLPAELTGERLKGLFGKPMNVIFRSLFPSLTDSETERLTGYCCEYEEALLSREKAPLFAGVKETLPRLAEKYPLFIASNCQKGYIEAFLENSGLGECVKDFMCFGDTNAPKSETIKRLIARNSLVSPVYVGDTQGDADACAMAGIPFVFAEYGFGNAAEGFIEKISSFTLLENLFFKSEQRSIKLA